MPPSFHRTRSGGVEACIAALHLEVLHPVVRRLRTTHRKLSLSDSTVCAFAPLEKRPRSVVPRDGESCIIVHHDESPCMTHGGAEMLVLHLVENVCVIPWPLVWWCKGTYGGASLRDFGVSGAKAPHHTPQTLAFRFHGVCLCITAEKTAVSWVVTRSPV